MYYFSKFTICLWVLLSLCFSPLDCGFLSFLTTYKIHFARFNLKCYLQLAHHSDLPNDAIKDAYKVLWIRKCLMAHLLQYRNHKWQDTFLILLNMNINSSEWEFYYNLTFMKLNKLSIYLSFWNILSFCGGYVNNSSGNTSSFEWLLRHWVAVVITDK